MLRGAPRGWRSGATEKTDPWNMGWLLRIDRRPEHDDGEKTDDGGDRPRTYDLTRPTRRSLACWGHADRLTAVGHGRESVAVARTCQERRDASSLSSLDGVRGLTTRRPRDEEAARRPGARTARSGATT